MRVEPDGFAVAVARLDLTGMRLEGAQAEVVLVVGMHAEHPVRVVVADIDFEIWGAVVEARGLRLGYGGGWYDRLGSTVVVNPGKQIGKVPPHVWLDTDAGRATWSGLGETDSLRLW